MLNRRDALKLLGSSALLPWNIAEGGFSPEPITIESAPLVDFADDYSKIYFEKWKIFKKWNPTKLLDRVERLSDKMELAVWLEKATHDSDITVCGNWVVHQGNNDSKSFLEKNNLPIVLKIFESLKSRRFVSFQSMLAPTQQIFSIQPAFASNIFPRTSAVVSASIKNSKLIFQEEIHCDCLVTHGISFETEFVDLLGSERAMEIDREIITDLRNSAPKFNSIKEATAHIEKHTGFKPNWSIQNTDYNNGTLKGGFGLEIQQQVEDSTKYFDPLFPGNQTLLGFQGGETPSLHSRHFTGYVYGMYIPQIISPVILGKDDFVPRRKIMSRRSKKMIDPNFYAVVET